MLLGALVAFILPAAASQPAAALPVLPQTGPGVTPEKPGLQKLQTGAQTPDGSQKPPTGTPTTGTARPLYSFAETLPKSVVKLDMVAIPAGTITLRGKVVPIKPFWIASTEMAWEAFDTFTASGPPSPAYDQTKFAADAIARPSKSYILPDLGWGHHGYPAINISILSAQMFCRWLSTQTGKKYRLPTEAEWEYAARAGKPGDLKVPPAQRDKMAWHVGISDKKSQPIGKKLPNAWKLYDMFGNVGEWAMDLDGKPVLCGSTFLDPPEKALNPGLRQYQTPAWQQTDPQLPKSRWWLADGKFVGFRVVCEP